MQDLPPPKPYYFFAKRSPLGSIIKIPPPTEQTEALQYKNLRCSDQDQKIIGEIVTTLSEHGKLVLWISKLSYLRELGAQISHVHPLKFLAVVFTNPTLTWHLRRVFEDHFKRNGFLTGEGSTGGLALSLHAEADKGRLMHYLHDFAAEIGIPAENIRPFFHSRDWESMVWYLLDSLGDGKAGLSEG